MTGLLSTMRHANFSAAWAMHLWTTWNQVTWEVNNINTPNQRLIVDFTARGWHERRTRACKRGYGRVDGIDSPSTTHNMAIITRVIRQRRAAGGATAFQPRDKRRFGVGEQKCGNLGNLLQFEVGRKTRAVRDILAHIKMRMSKNIYIHAH